MEKKQLSRMKTPQILWKKQIQIMKMEKYVSTITSNFCKSVQEHRCFPETKMEMLVKGIRFLQMVQNLPMHQTLPIV